MLPDSPGTLMNSGSEHQTDSIPYAQPDVAKKYTRVIAAGQQSQPLSTKDKLVLALATRATLSATAGTLFSTGLGYWSDDVPHFGVDLPAFGDRFAAGELKATTESIFSYGIYAGIFHDDPRYYVMGPRKKIAKRAIYSATRVVITRKDDGRTAVNWPKLAGLASAAALTNAYYPQEDRRVGRTASSILSSIATTAGLNELHEFLGDALHLVFHRNKGSDKP